MAYQSGKGFRLRIQTSADGIEPVVYAVVKGMNTVDVGATTNITRTPTFDSPTQIATIGAPEESFAVAGLFDPVDPGQEATRAAARAQTPIMFEVTHDGTNGYERAFLVTGRTWGSNADGTPQAQSFELVPDGEPTIVGTGPLP